MTYSSIGLRGVTKPDWGFAHFLSGPEEIKPEQPVPLSTQRKEEPPVFQGKIIYKTRFTFKGIPF